MALGEALIDAGGVSHRMAGRLGLVTSYAKRRMHLGYRRATLLGEVAGMPEGAVLGGMSFITRPSSNSPMRRSPMSSMRKGCGAGDRSRRGAVTGTFFHLVARWW